MSYSHMAVCLERLREDLDLFQRARDNVVEETRWGYVDPDSRFILRQQKEICLRGLRRLGEEIQRLGCVVVSKNSPTI